MKQAVFFSFFLGLLFFFIQCNKNTNSSNTLNFQIINRINNIPIELGKQYLLKNNDSIIIERMDYYISMVSIENGQNTITDNSLFLINNSNNTFSISNSQSINSFTNLKLNLGLTSDQNNSNPTSFSYSNPLSSSQNMYWSSWTKYRYVVFEGRIISNGQNKTFAYHTGLEYNTLVTASGSQTLNSTASIYLNIDKIFYPSSGNNINLDNELITHSEASQDAITKKFIQNLSNAFSF